MKAANFMKTAVISTTILSGCATIPDVTVKYYPATWKTVARVTQTVACNAAKTDLIALNTPSVVTTYASDIRAKPFEVQIRGLDRWFADSDLTVSFTEDGRLKSINQSTTGQGETIVKSAVALAAATSSWYVSLTLKDKKVIPECEVINAWGGGKPVSLTYETPLNASALGIDDLPVQPSKESEVLYSRLNTNGRMPSLAINVSGISPGTNRPDYPVVSSNVVLLELQKTGSFDVSFKAGKDGIGSARVVVPQSETYTLPIPKAALFGKQSFSLALSEAGAVTSIGYGRNAGAAGAINALAALAGTDSPSTKAAELKAESDLIAQQQRRLLCETKPSDCK